MTKVENINDLNINYNIVCCKHYHFTVAIFMSNYVIIHTTQTNTIKINTVNHK